MVPRICGVAMGGVALLATVACETDRPTGTRAAWSIATTQMASPAAIRCCWTPGTSFGTGLQSVGAIAYAEDGTVVAYTPVVPITTTNP